MINYSNHTLSNGLTVMLHEDANTPLVSVNVLYNVGARDEDPNRTGFAHLFEHLMFGGTKEVPDYDLVVNSVGGESNAFTNNDYTNYYLTVPASSLETALALEADRMRLLDFSERSLSVQQHVVTEEYHQRYENQPYGDVHMLLRPLCYKKHPYQWCTIGSDIRHVQQARLEDVEQFFFRYYRPENAILAVAGPIKSKEALRLVEHHFGNIPSGGAFDPNEAKAFARSYPQEDEQTERRELTVERQVPNDALYMAFPMCDRRHPDYYVFDIISDVLSNGKSSRLYNSLVKERQIFTEINAYISGETDNGLFLFSGRMHENVSVKEGEKAIWEELERIKAELIPDLELLKVVNKYETTFLFSQYKALDRAMGLCYYEWLGMTERVNTEPDYYKPITPERVREVAHNCFQPEKCSVLYYLKSRKEK